MASTISSLPPPRGGGDLRQEPSGRVLARLGTGALLQELERIPGWIRVRRTVWIWSEALNLNEGEEPPATTTPVPQRSVAPVVSAGPSRGLSALGRAILSEPGGDTLATTLSENSLQLLAREGAWVRVRVEGWVWSPADGLDNESGGAPVAADPSTVAGDPDAYRGRVVSWMLQFISLERAESIRTEFVEGEPFLLMRPSGGDGPFVYVAVSEERLEEVESLLPLENVVVVGRVRTGASELTGSPVLDLMELRREREGGSGRDG